MKAKIIGFSVALTALAAGVMFCGDSDLIDPDDQNATTPEPNVTNDVPNPAKLSVELEFADSGRAEPVYWAVRTGDVWRRPGLTDGRFKLTLADATAAYGVVTVCQGPDRNGQPTFHTRVVEATAGELPSLSLVCPTTDAGKLVQVSGAIRNVNGQPVTLTVGTQSTVVENPKAAKDVLFAMDAPAGKQTFVATIGTGEKQSFASATTDVVAGGTVELDAASASHLSPKTFPVSAGAGAQPIGGVAGVWVDGRSRIASEQVQWGEDADGPNVAIPSTMAANDFIDLRTKIWSADADPMNSPPLADMRFVSRANSQQPLSVPYMTWVAESQVRLSSGHVEFSWTVANWAVFGPRGDDFAVFAPVAYVGRATAIGQLLDVVVTPNRLRGQRGVYTVPALDELDGFDRRWTFPSDRKEVRATAGNLSALANEGAPDPAHAIAAYLDPMGERSPADLGVVDSMTVVVVGFPATTVTRDASLLGELDTRCEEQRECALKIENDVMAVQDCPGLAVFQDCKAEAPDLPAIVPADFVRDLEREIVRWYVAAKIPKAVPLAQALEGISEEGVHEVPAQEAGEWWAYDPSIFQVFWHVDTTRVDSKAVWYGAYLAGRLVSIHAVNWDVPLP